MRLLVVVEDDEVVAEPQVVAGRLLLGALVGEDQWELGTVAAQLADLVVWQNGHGSKSLTHAKRGIDSDPEMTVSLKTSRSRVQKSTPRSSPCPSIEPGVSGL